MDDLQSKLEAMLSDPQTMQKIMGLAQTLGGPQPSADPPSGPPAEVFPAIDPGMLRKLTGLARSSTIDKDQQTLLRALTPYLSRERIGKLEKAMRAARMARMAAGALAAPDR